MQGKNLAGRESERTDKEKFSDYPGYVNNLYVTSLSNGCPNTVVSQEDPGSDAPGLARDKVR